MPRNSVTVRGVKNCTLVFRPLDRDKFFLLTGHHNGPEVGVHVTRAQARKFNAKMKAMLDATEPKPEMAKWPNACEMPDYSGAPSADLCAFKKGHRGAHSWEWQDQKRKGTGRAKP